MTKYHALFFINKSIHNLCVSKLKIQKKTRTDFRKHTYIQGGRLWVKIFSFFLLLKPLGNGSATWNQNQVANQFSSRSLRRLDSIDSVCLISRKGSCSYFREIPKANETLQHSRGGCDGIRGQEILAFSNTRHHSCRF